MHDFRRYYQDSFVEPYLIFLPLGIHMVSSIFRAMLRPKDAKPDSERSLHRNLGWLLVPLTILHAFGARVGPVLKQGREMAAQKDFATFAVVANAVPAAVIGSLPPRSCRNFF